MRLYVFRQDSYVDVGECDGKGGGSLAMGTSGNIMAATSVATAEDLSISTVPGAGDNGGKVKTHFETSALRLNHPNDDLGSMLLMCLPQVVVHEIDASSPT